MSQTWVLTPNVIARALAVSRNIIWLLVKIWYLADPGRLLPDLVHQGVVRLGCHLVTAIMYQCSNLWVVRHFG